MTLATVPRYDPDQLTKDGGRAVVIGAGIAGLCAARVLADAFDTVTVVERDELPGTPDPRGGVPQGHHIHVLLQAARTTLSDLFPEFGEALLAAGGLTHDMARDAKIYMEGDFLAEGPRRRSVYAATRPLYELVLRRRVTDIDDVQLRSQTQFTGYLLDDDGTAVTGIELRDEDGQTTDLPATVVVDATGRMSRTPDWLGSHGYAPPPVAEVHVDVAYSTTFIDRPSGDRRGMMVAPSPDQPRGGTYVPVEDGRWLMTLWGMHGDEPPTDSDEFATYAASLPVPDLSHLLEEHPRESDEIAYYPFPSNRRRRYERLDRFPDGLVVLGDAIASFNPIYGQGMSVAALEAVQLHHTLAGDSHDDLGLRFFDRVAETVDIAWNMAVGSDHSFPGTEGPKPWGTDVLNWYLARLIRRAHTDGELVDAFLQVQMMAEEPTSLLQPSVIWRVFKPR